jgi:hypothetical protein
MRRYAAKTLPFCREKGFATANGGTLSQVMHPAVDRLHKVAVGFFKPLNRLPGFPVA